MPFRHPGLNDSESVITLSLAIQSSNSSFSGHGCRTGKLLSLIVLALFPLADPAGMPAVARSAKAGGSSAGIGDEESASRIGE
jgi:hypothetical protein